MSVTRIHIVLSAEERARYRAQAEREGQSLSEWLRGAARARLEAATQRRLDTVAELDEFFASRDASEQGREPDWDEHRAVIESSRARTPPS